MSRKVSRLKLLIQVNVFLSPVLRSHWPYTVFFFKCFTPTVLVLRVSLLQHEQFFARAAVGESFSCIFPAVSLLSSPTLTRKS